MRRSGVPEFAQHDQYGANGTSPSCLRNAVSLFHVLEKELAWRKDAGRPVGFDTMRASKPIVAVGAEHPLEDETLMADHFRKPPPR